MRPVQERLESRFCPQYEQPLTENVPTHIIQGVAWQERKPALPRVLDAHEVLIR